MLLNTCVVPNMKVVINGFSLTHSFSCQFLDIFGFSRQVVTLCNTVQQNVKKAVCLFDVGYCEKDGVSIGFGECRGRVLPAIMPAQTS